MAVSHCTGQHRRGRRGRGRFARSFAVKCQLILPSESGLRKPFYIFSHYQFSFYQFSMHLPQAILHSFKFLFFICRKLHNNALGGVISIFAYKLKGGGGTIRNQ